LTDNTSPVAKLAAALPKGNGLARAVPLLFEQRGALVPFVGLMRVEESGLDADDVQHLKGSIARFELCLGALERDGRDLLGRCSQAATSREGQQALFADDADFEAQRTEAIGYLREWAAEQNPPLDDDTLEERWQSFHGGHYDARLEHGAPAHLREFAISIGALADSTAGGDLVTDADAEDDGFGEDDEPAEHDDDPAVPQPAFSGAPQ
jgi:hypothetical protein